MRWNWQLTEWSNLIYDPAQMPLQERRFLMNTGGATALLKNVGQYSRKRRLIQNRELRYTRYLVKITWRWTRRLPRLAPYAPYLLNMVW